MITKTTLALALVLGTVSFAAAQDSDPNLFNRYPAYNMTTQSWSQSINTRSVALTPRVDRRALDRASWSTGQ